MPRGKSQTSVLALLDVYHASDPFMAIFQGFFDESGKFRDKRVISFCGLCSPPKRVAEFEDDWKALLREYGLASLTMKRALRRKRKFSNRVAATSVEERNAVLGRFAECIRKHFEVGIPVTVDVGAYKSFAPTSKHRIFGSDNPHYFAFIHGLVDAVQYIEVQKENRLMLICDDDLETAITCYRLYRKARFTVPQIKETLVAIAFAEDDEFAPLQAADLVSSIFRLEAARAWHREYYEYVPLFNALTAPAPFPSGIQWRPHPYPREALNDLAKNRPPSRQGLV